MHIARDRINGIAVLSVAGQLDDLSVDLFFEQITRTVERKSVRVGVDLAGVNFLSGSGLRMLLTGLIKVRQHGGDLRLVGVPRQANRLLKITGAVDVLSIYSDVAAAITSFQPEHLIESPLCAAAC